MELSLSHTLHLFNIFREYDGKDNCTQVLEEEIYKMFGTKSLNDEHDCNVVSMILVFNWIMPHMIVILLSLLSLPFMRRILLMWRVVNFLCL